MIRRIAGAALLCLALTACIPTILEWQQVGVYGPHPTSLQILAAVKEVFEQNGYRVSIFEPKQLRVETEWKNHHGLNSGLREQIRVQLLMQEGKSYVFVMAVMNENVLDFDPLRPGEAAWGPDENFKSREYHMHRLIHQKIMQISQNR
ncbi:MAG TPA: hypothetical protein VI643_07840 [Planctomycetota bacterium]|nr:hypothetical protein [Planctomycetota bacterium]